MKFPKIRVNKKNYDETILKADHLFGNFDYTTTIDVDNYPVTILVQEPTKEKPFYTLITVGLQFMKFPEYRKKLDGFELLMRLPYSWKFPQNGTDVNAWPLHIIQSIVSIMLSGSAMLPNTSYQFDYFTNETQQKIAIVHHSLYYEDKPAVVLLKKKDVVFLEVQTMLDEEFRALREQKNEKILFLLFSLPCIDLKRESLCCLAK